MLINSLLDFLPKTQTIRGKPTKNLVNAGTLRVSKAGHQFLFPQEQKNDFGRDIFSENAQQNVKCMPYNTSEYLKDMGDFG